MSEATVSSQQQSPPKTSKSSSQSSSILTSPSNSLSIIKLDELSSYGATKKNRLPTLIKMNDQLQQQEQVTAAEAGAISMPAFSAEQLEQASALSSKQQVSLPARIDAGAGDKENLSIVQTTTTGAEQENISEDFQMIDMTSADMIGPSLPAPQGGTKTTTEKQTGATVAETDPSSLTLAAQKILASSQQLNQQSSYLGDSLIEMIINLRNENQNLVKALETNNEYVKDRLEEFKRFNEEAKKREIQFANERAEHEHQVRKLKRQNTVLSDRLKSMEAKLKDMRLEVGESLNAAHSSKASSVQGNLEEGALYPALDASMESFGNSALNSPTTMQVDQPTAPEPAPAPAMELGGELLSGAARLTSNITQPKSIEGLKLADMSKEELSKRFDADKAAFYAMDDPMKQCDKLEQQLNDIGRRDYEICLLQQQLNIYRQDFRLERMANLEAKIQIEKLKNDIDRLCFQRLNEKNNHQTNQQTTIDDDSPPARTNIHRGSHNRHSSSGIGGVRFDAAATAAADAVSKLGIHLSKRASRSAAKAAKYASKQAYREEKAAAASAAAAAAAAAAQAQSSGTGESGSERHHHHHHRRGHHHHHHEPKAPGPMRGLRNEVVNDLLSTANKAMLTGYKMASTHVNLAIDKLSQFEQAQAANLEKNKSPPKPSTSAGAAPSAPPMGSPSLD